ncbi:hypothetical protein [Mucilaginibacter sp. L3T2-6]|uniref:hypothetical protein n=1 Tax=Mucilaginibacter sp. L3T2-6 TaxID=3062491 RepID=UPI002676B9E4|nr:hypothetical protein [Mucilaginibacter sp. L3T2-6]MDO3642226.1 hypothetical protein [Mucilaginibacter sp. L3T2-6]MDV6214721.1 hypothetical protein [Mucilaginibacter sp. L3T2-6]
MKKNTRYDKYKMKNSKVKVRFCKLAGLFESFAAYKPRYNLTAFSGWQRFSAGILRIRQLGNDRIEKGFLNYFNFQYKTRTSFYLTLPANTK